MMVSVKFKIYEHYIYLPANLDIYLNNNTVEVIQPLGMMSILIRSIIKKDINVELV